MWGGRQRKPKNVSYNMGANQATLRLRGGVLNPKWKIAVHSALGQTHGKPEG